MVFVHWVLVGALLLVLGYAVLYFRAVMNRD